MEQKEVFDFYIAGLPYKLRSSHSEEVVAELVQMVDHRIRDALAVTKSGSIQNAAVLAALNIAEELVLLRKQALAEVSQLEERSKKWQQDIEKIKNEASRQDTAR